jgi:hypothetical protein
VAAPPHCFVHRDVMNGKFGPRGNAARPEISAAASSPEIF